MIFTYSVKKGCKPAVFVNEAKANVRSSKSGNAYSTMIGSESTVILTIDGKSKEITGAELIKKLFGKK